MEKIGFKSGEADMTVYFWFGEGGSIEIAGCYVNDGLLATNSKDVMQRMTADIRGSFDIQDLGDPTQLLGIKITRSRPLGTIHISQLSFITTISKQFNVTLG